MNLLVFVGVTLLLIAFLVLLSVWQRKIEESHSERVVAQIQEAQEYGTHLAPAQYPQIDVRSCIGCGSCVAVCPEEGVLGLVDGVARVIHGSRCVGHARCADVCPVAAIQVGLGDTRHRTDIPLLTETLETTVPGIYIAGELGGFALIKLAAEQGTKALVQIAQSLRGHSRTKGVRDVLIVGAGPAGLAASLKAKELGLDAIAIDQDDIGGTVRTYPRRKLVLTNPFDLPLYGRVKQKEYIKEELIEFWEQLISEHRLAIQTGCKLQSIDLLGETPDEGFLAHTSGGDIRTRRILLCLGKRGSPRKLGVPGENHEKVLYQLVDTATYNNEHILVVGGGDSAIEAATGLANQTGNVVTLSYRRDRFFRIKPRNADRIREYEADGRVHVLYESRVVRVDPRRVMLSAGVEEAESTLELDNDWVFVFAGGEPPYPLLQKIGVRFGGESAEASPQAETVGAPQ